MSMLRSSRLLGIQADKPHPGVKLALPGQAVVLWKDAEGNDGL